MPACKPGTWQDSFPSLYPIVPANFTGTIVPDPALDGKNLEYFDNWVPAAEIVMSASHPKYHEAHNFGPATMTADGPQDGAKVFLCHGENCGSPGECSWEKLGEPGWYARIEYRGTTQYACVKRKGHSHEGRPIPGTARWFWDANDEKGWIACALGCCTLQ